MKRDILIAVAVILPMYVAAISAVEPELNAVQRYAATIANVTNATVDTGVSSTQERMDRIAVAFISHADWENEFLSQYELNTVESATNSQKASFVLQKIRDWAKKILQTEGEKTAYPSEAEVSAAGAAASDDF